MNKKVSILIISIILTFIVFIISTYAQKKLINYVPTVKCIVVTEDIEAHEQIDIESIKYVDMPISIVANLKIAKDIEDISSLYLKDKLYKGQLLLLDQFDSKENLMIYNADIGKEKISIKVKSPENGVSYTIRENSLVNIYATMRKEYMKNDFFSGDIISVGDENDSYCIVKILDSVKVLGTFDINGEVAENNIDKTIDTILIAVNPQEAKLINLYRDIASYSITELGNCNIAVE